MVRPCELVADVQCNAAAHVLNDVASFVGFGNGVSSSTVHFEDNVSVVSEFAHKGDTRLRQSFNLIVRRLNLLLRSLPNLPRLDCVNDKADECESLNDHHQ